MCYNLRWPSGLTKVIGVSQSFDAVCGTWPLQVSVEALSLSLLRHVRPFPDNRKMYHGNLALTLPPPSLTNPQQFFNQGENHEYYFDIKN
jgi:hypothetical protein